MKSKEWKYRITNYRQAWLEFRKSEKFRNIDNILRGLGIGQRYRSNIIRDIFDEGFIRSGVKIDWVEEDGV